MNPAKLILPLIMGVCLGMMPARAQQGIVAAGGESSSVTGERMSHSAGLTDYIFAAGPSASMQFGVQHFVGTPFFVPGDANCDGAVDVLDVIAIAEYYIDHDPQPFCFENADVNADGIINILDLVGTVNLFLYGKKYVYEGIVSAEARLILSSQGIELWSDGTLTGLQLELVGSGSEHLDPELLLSGHSLFTGGSEGSFRALVFSPENAVFPPGMIELLRFHSPGALPYWGEVVAANVNAEQVAVVTIRDDATGIDVPEGGFSYSVYPNPVGSRLYVRLAGFREGKVRVALLSMHGQLISEQTPADSHTQQLQFDMSGLPPGVYTVRLTRAGEHYYEKIVRR
ncbi:MAG: T9SS type A sorting domain-containing protein [Bacteroidales bacterium]|nr:T9SS type A sorting domain-containing protein [Bacteroidales bacterium]